MARIVHRLSFVFDLLSLVARGSRGRVRRRPRREEEEIVAKPKADDDRELYTHLWTDSLREETKALPLAANSAYHIQLLSSGSNEDNLLYLKYYADDDFRRHWQKDFPNDPIPMHEDPPYDRDRLLPQPDYGPPTGQMPN